MALVNVSGNPLNVIVQLFFAPLNAGATQNSQYVQSNEALINALPLLPSGLKAQLSPITPFLQTPLGNLFNNAWTGLQSSVQNTAASQFASAANSGGQGVSNVSCSLPSSGTVLAAVTPAQGANPANVLIDFHLPGGDFHFYAGPLGAGWKIDFDADITVFTPVPVQPFSLTPVATATLSNAQMHADNFGADIDEGLDDFFTALGNFFTGGNYVSDVDWDMQQAQQQTDQSQTLSASTVGTLLSLFNVLNAAGPQCVALGLTQCAFSIVNNSTLTLTITHPLDPGPTMQDAYHPAGVLILPPTLAATATEATPGSPITAFGSNFPVNTTTSLSLEFPNTSSGTPTQAEVRFDGQNHTVTAPAGSNTSLVYTYNPTALTVGKTYAFEARCGDELTWSQWGPSFSLATAPTHIADLVLTPTGGGQTWTLGSSPLPPANTNWTCSGTIPAAVPPGQYNLEARLGSTLIAETPISIVTTLTAGIEIIDPTTQAVVEAPIWGDQPFTLRGFGFPNGPVTISFNGASVATANTSGGGFTIPLTTPGTAWTVEIVNVTATSGAIVATLNPPIDLEGQPQ